MAAADPLANAVQAWNKRFRAATLGASPQAVAAVRSADLQKIRAGGSGMSNQEAAAAIQSASQGQVANPPKPASTSLFNLLGNVPKDIGGIATGLGIGAAHLISHPARDIKGAIGRVEDIGRAVGSSSPGTTEFLQKKYGLEGTLGSGGELKTSELGKVRDVLRLVNFLPGATTSLNLLSGKQGLQNIERHPVTSALDIGAIPAFRGATEAEAIAKPGLLRQGGTFGTGVEMTSAVRDTLSNLAKVAPGSTLGVEGPLGRFGLKTAPELPGSASQAFAKGQITRGLVRDAYNGISKLYYGGRVHGPTQTRTAIRAGREAESQLVGQELKVSHAKGRGGGVTKLPQSGTKVRLTPEQKTLLSTATAGREAKVAAGVRAGELRMTIPSIISHHQLTQAASRILSQLLAEGRDAVKRVESKQQIYENFIRENLPDSLRKELENWTAKPPTPPMPGQADLSATPAHIPVQQRLTVARTPSTPTASLDPAKLSYTDIMKVANDPLDTTLPPKLKGFLQAYDSENNDLISVLPEDQQKSIGISYWKQSHSAMVGLLYNMGVIKTTSDMEALTSNLPDALKAAYMGHPTSEMVLMDKSELSGLVPEHLFRQLPDDHSAMWIQRDAYNVMYGKYGMWSITHGKFDVPLPIRAAAPITKIFKAGVFMRPSTLLHLTVGNAILMANQGVDVLNLPKLIQAVREHSDLPAYIATDYKGYSGGALFQWLSGKSIGRILDTLPNGVTKLIDHVTAVQRMLVHLDKYQPAVDAYLKTNPAATLEEAQQVARTVVTDSINKVMMSFDYATPFERQIMKQVLPFYNYQKHIFNFLSTFPANHPFVAAYIANLAQNEMRDAETGLPALFQQMFTLGQPDSKGNVRAIDVRSFNPFRSFGTDLTLSGLAGSLNPALQFTLQSFGVNSQGQPSIYPLLTVDPNTGGLAAIRPKFGFTSLAEAIIPEMRTIDGMLGWNTRLRALQKEDPSAATAYFWNTIGIPWDQAVNIPTELARHEKALFTVAQRDVTQYLKTGDYSWINGYLQVPFHGKMWTPAQLHQYYTNLIATHPAPKGASEKGEIPRKIPGSQVPPGATPTTASGLQGVLGG